MRTQIHIVNHKDTRNIANPIPDGVNIIEEIIAEDGMRLTQSADVPLEKRIISRAVMLGKGHSADEWKEILSVDADAILAEQETLNKTHEDKIGTNFETE